MELYPAVKCPGNDNGIMLRADLVHAGQVIDSMFTTDAFKKAPHADARGAFAL